MPLWPAQHSATYPQSRPDLPTIEHTRQVRDKEVMGNACVELDRMAHYLLQRKKKRADRARLFRRPG